VTGRLSLRCGTARVARLVVVAVLALVAACGGGEEGRTEAPPAPPQRLRLEVVEARRHDTGAFTEGLVAAGGRLFESTGLLGQSSVRELNPLTGEVIRQTALAPDLFGEGLAAVGDDLIQLTWQNGIALVWNRDNLTQKGLFSYEGEGWGLCFDPTGPRLVQSDGSDQLIFRDSSDFHRIGQVSVTRDGRPLDQLNELECAADGVWANVWHSDTIVRIDPATGRVTAFVDAPGLGPPGAGPDDVLNGIARLADGTWLITGKRWPTMYLVRFLP
jgi:glutamine cyclotransferase